MRCSWLSMYQLRDAIGRAWGRLFRVAGIIKQSQGPVHAVLHCSTAPAPGSRGFPSCSALLFSPPRRLPPVRPFEFVDAFLQATATQPLLSIAASQLPNRMFLFILLDFLFFFFVVFFIYLLFFVINV